MPQLWTKPWECKHEHQPYVGAALCHLVLCSGTKAYSPAAGSAVGRKPSAARSPPGRPEHRGSHLAWLVREGPRILTPTWDNLEVIPTSGLPRGLTKASVQTALLCNFSLFPSLLPLLHFPSTGTDPKSTQPANLLSEEQVLQRCHRKGVW